MVVPARPAASVVVVRPASHGGWETYLLRRSAQSPVLADLWVFPGGTVRADDLTPSTVDAFPGFSPEAAHRALTRAPGGPAPTPVESWGYFLAAARELLEEAGVLLGGADRLDLDSARTALEGGLSLADVACAHSITIDLSRLVYYAHWITPEAAPQRFDTRFFISRLPTGQEPSPSKFEMSEGMWLSPGDALERNRAGALPLHFATINHLKRIAPFASLEAVLEFAAKKPVIPVMPNARTVNGQLIPALSPALRGDW